MAKTLLDKIHKKVKSIDRKKIQQEIALLESSFPAVSPGYRPHKVCVDGSDFDSYRAKQINRARNQSRAGDYRYLANEGQVVGLAVHANSGGYRRIVWNHKKTEDC